MQRKYIDFTNGKSRIYGYDYGIYPIHKFRHSNPLNKNYPLYAESAGDDLWHNQCCRQRINSGVFAIEYVTEGVFVFNHNDVEEECGAGDVFLVHQGSNSGMRCKTITAAKKVIIMQGKALSNLLSCTELDRVFRIKVVDRQKVDELFEKILSFNAADVSGKISVYCYELLLTLAEQAVISPRPLELQKAVEMCHRNLDNPVSLSELAHYAGVSSATLNRLFHEYLQTSPMEYFRKLRMEKVRQLLKYYPVKMVADMMNFSSTQYLAGEFKKIFGVPPKIFRSKQ